MMKKSVLLAVIIWMYILFMGGCSSQGEEFGVTDFQETEDRRAGEKGQAGQQETEDLKTKDGHQEDGDQIMVASFEDIPGEIADGERCLPGDETLYFSKVAWNLEKEWLETEIYRCSIPLSGNGVELIYESAGEQEVLNSYFADRQNNIYLWGYCAAESLGAGDQEFFIEKRDRDNKLLYRRELPAETASEMERKYIKDFAADESGNLYFYSPGGDILALNGMGEETGQASLKVRGSGAVVTGSRNQAWFYCVEEDGISFYPLNGMTQKAGGEAGKQRLIFDEKDKSAAVFSGYDDGIYIVMDKKIYCYSPESDELREMADCESPYINIAEKEIYLAAPFLGGMTVILEDVRGTFTELAVLDRKAAAQLPERQEIVLGVMGELVKENLALNRVIRNFNRENLELCVVVENYAGGQAGGFDDMQKLYLELLEGGGPDMLLLDSTWSEVWARNGLLEDLEPYFEKSETIGREDILDSVWEGCYLDHRMIGIPLYFRVTGFSVKKEDIPKTDVWDSDTVLNMAENNPDRYLFEYMTPVSVLLYMMKMNASDFVDYDNYVCCFDQEKFRELAERVKNISYPIDFKPFKGDFMESPYLMNQEYFLCMRDYLAWKETYSAHVSLLGYPSPGEKGQFAMIADMLGINSASTKKESAWKFLEYALDKPAQTWGYKTQLISFPVRKDSFEEYLANSYPQDPSVSMVIYHAAEDDFNAMREIVENAQIVPLNSSDPVTTIVIEEIQSYFAGDKELEEVTHIIQNRCQLYLDELKN